MSERVVDFRCSAASDSDDEPLAATAPDDTRWLFVEQPTGWGPKVALQHAERDVRVQWIRRPGGGSTPGLTRVFWAARSRTGFDVRSGEVASVDAAGQVRPADLTPYDGPLLMVCTHGRRDVCCAEQGRPVAAALAAAHPEATWETSHLGGHRFAATLLVLPSGLVVGRVGVTAAVAVVAEVLAGRWPADVVRGRAGTPARAQAAEAFARAGLARAGLDGVGLEGVGLDDVRVGADDGDVVQVLTPSGSVGVRVERGASVARRQSCAEERLKPAPTWRCAVLSG